jgi:hypothetical protein
VKIFGLVAIPVLLAAPGCGGKSAAGFNDPADSGADAGRDVGTPVGPIDAGAAPGDVVGRPWSEDLRATCPASPLEIVDWSTEVELATLVRGQWIACAPTTAWPSKMIGLELRDDRTWVLLVVDATRAVARGRGIDETGKWVVTFAGTGSGPLALGIQFDAQPNGGTSVSRAIFTEQPAQMRLGDILGTFVRPR